MTTIRDVAERAGVSSCTVSRYLNGKIRVKDTTAANIDRAIQELSYIPNSVAKSLKKNTTTNVAVILPTINNLYYSEVTAGINASLGLHGYQLHIIEYENTQLSEEDVLLKVRENLMAGAVFVGFSIDFAFSRSLTRLTDNGIPVVYMNREIHNPSFPVVYPDFSEVGRLAAEYLLARGRESFGILMRQGTEELRQSHILRFIEAVEAAGCKQAIRLYSEYENPISESILSSIREHALDALFVVNEIAAIRTVKQLRKAGLRVPEDISVMGLGDSILGECSSPGLTTVDLRDYELGFRSGESLLSQIEHKPYEKKIVLEPKILVRESA